MKKGDIVTVYRDPLTKKVPEGEAELVTKLLEWSDSEYWVVRFTSDQSEARRQIGIPG